MRANQINFTFHPPERPSAPGSPQLEMILRDRSKAGVDGLEQVTLRIATPADLPEKITLCHPWPYADCQQVCAGNIVLQLMRAERVIAFTFGGELVIQPQPGETLFILNSPAPILRLEGFDQTSTILANEVAILFAEKRAKELPDLDVYNKRLICEDSFVVYCACLKVLKEKFKELSRPESPSMLNFYTFLGDEIASLQSLGLWPNRASDMADWFQTES